LARSVVADTFEIVNTTREPLSGVMSDQQSIQSSADSENKETSNSLFERLHKRLDGYQTLVLIGAPIVIPLLTAMIVWSYLHSTGGARWAFGAAFVAAIVTACFGILVSVFLSSLFKRFGQLRSALNVVDTSLIIYDKNRKVVQFNQGAYQYHKKRGTTLRNGMSETELIELAAHRRFTDPVDISAWRDLIIALRKQHLNMSKPITVETLEHEDLECRQFQQVLLAHLPNGHMVDMRTDVTALKTKELMLADREQELEKSRNAAQASNRAKSEFLANMSHEIRTPMNGVIGMTELLLDSGLNDDQRLYATTAVSSAQSLLILINDILDFSKVEAGKLELDPQPFNLRRTFDDVAAMLATKAHAKGLELVMNYAPDLPAHFIADEGRIRQIITNLAGNAIKFTESGHVAIQVNGEINAAEGESATATLSVSITDTGIGIAADKQERVFNLFEQADGASNRRYEGSGLGLAITRRLLHLMQSDIELDSELNVGSEFSFNITLPLDQNQVHELVPSEAVSLHGLRVLLVDDLPLNNEILSRRMMLWDMIPIVAESGEAALELIKSESVDLAILDYQMPNMDGHELCRRIKSNPNLANLPIILLSSVDQSVQGAQVRELGFSGCLVKPVRTELLLKKIVTAMSDVSADVSAADHASKLVRNDATNANSLQSSDVLVVEDNLVNQMVICGMLESFGIQPRIAENGRIGVEEFKQKRPDLVFMDISMPEMNGMDATNLIREYEVTSTKLQCPIIALTANAMKGDRENCIAAGMDDFLSKPVLLEDLSVMLERWLLADSMTQTQEQRRA